MRWTFRARLPIALAAALAAVSGRSASAQTVDEIVAKNLAARGGVEKLRAVDTVRTTGTMTARGLQMEVTTSVKRPNRMRRETSFPGRQVTIAFDGTDVWGLDSSTGRAERMTGPQAEATREETEIDPLFLDYKEKGHRVELAGSETIDGTRVHHLRVTKKSGQVADYYLSVDSGLERRIVQTFQQGGMKVEVRTDLSDYRSVDGMQVPFAIKQYHNGNLAVELALKAVEFNVPMDDSQFRLK